MRIVSHTCSNTEIVCALGLQDTLVAVDSDSDFPPDVVGRLPQLGRDLQLDVAAALALRPDLVLTSLTVPGHERIVDAFATSGVPLVVCDPQNLDDVFDDIRRIAIALGDVDAQTHTLAPDRAPAIPIDVVAMSWCGVKVDKYRADVVLRREHWHDVPAIRDGRVVAISEEYLGRPAPRLVEGYRQLRAAITAKSV
jgi:iron complex transport system substrate-binding protein